MPSEFDQLMSQCEELTTKLKTCHDPEMRRQLLMEMKIVLDAANRIVFDFPINGNYISSPDKSRS
jgi:hypothetical protein